MLISRTVPEGVKRGTLANFQFFPLESLENFGFAKVIFDIEIYLFWVFTPEMVPADNGKNFNNPDANITK